MDDGSPDACPSICDEYAAKDDRIRVMHKENGGLSSARNAGLVTACGTYVIFLDSDDFYLENNFLDKIFAIVEEKNAKQSFLEEIFFWKRQTSCNLHAYIRLSVWSCLPTIK